MQALSKLCVAGLLCALAASAATADTTLPLNGPWQVQRSSESDPARLGGQWQDAVVPGQVEQAPEPFAWYRRSFVPPENMAGQHAFLSFGGVKFACEVYLNGQRVGSHYGGWEPFEVEVTKACRAGQPNELRVRVADVRAVIDGEVAYSPGRNLVESVNGRVMAPVGSQPWLSGIWQDVSFIVREDLSVEDVTIVTSVRQKRIEVRYVLRNLSDRERQATISGAVRDGVQTALYLDTADVKLPPGGTAEAVLRKPWTDPVLWSPTAPKLYMLQSTLTSPDRKAPFDVRMTRFGFREFWTDGIYLVLNGDRIKFLATAGHPPWNGQPLTDDQIRTKYADIRSVNCMAMRLHANVWPENWYNVADEVGLPIIEESAIWCYAQNYAIEKKQFWDNAREHWRNVIRRDKNHPSVVMYSIENEMLDVGGIRVPETPKNLGDLGRFVKSLDPTRPIMYDGDEDPDGAADVVNLHYPHEFPEHTLYPSTCYWLERRQKLDSWPSTEWEWSRKKPLYMGEFLWVHAPDPQGMTLFLGDDAYRDLEGGHRRSKAIAWEMQIQAFRAAEVAGMCPWTVWESGDFPNEQSEAVRRAYEPNAAFVKEYDSHFYAAEAVPRTVYVYNDTRKPADLMLQWSLGGWQQGEKPFSLQPGERVETTVPLTMPAAAENTPAPFELIVKSGGQMVYRKVRDYVVYPRSDPRFNVPAGARAAVYGGDAQFLDLLRRGGLEPITLDDVGKVGGSGEQLLIIAAHALDALAGREQMPVVGEGAYAALSRFAAGGGTVLVLEQDRYPADMLPASLTDRAASIAFGRSKSGGILDGLTDDSLRWWRGDELVATHLIVRPREGGFRVFVDTGGPSGLDGVLLLEVLQGKGRYILSQLLIAGKLGREPLAQVMLERLVAYAAKTPAPRQPIGVVLGPAPFDADLKALGAEFENLTGKLSSSDLSGYRALLLDGSSEEVLAARQALKAYAAAGGQVVLHALTDKAMAALADAVPGGLSVQASVQVPVLVAGTDDATADGLMNEDLYWVSRSGDYRTQSTLATDVLHGEITRRLPPADQLSMFDAQSLRLPPSAQGSAAVREGELVMWARASAEAQIVLPRTGEYFFGVVGRGTPALGAYPHVAVYLDDKAIGSLQIGSKEAASFSILAQADAGNHLLRLTFDNDAVDPATGDDRNLWLDKFFYAASRPGPEKNLLRPGGLVKLGEGKGFWLLDQVAWDGRTAASDQAARYLCGLLTNLGVAFKGTQGGVVISAARMEPDRAENFHREGDIAFMGSNGNISLDVRFSRAGRFAFAVNAKGTIAEGEYPAIRLLLDNTPIGEGQLKQGGWQNLSFAADVTAGVHKLAVEFTNDRWVPEKGEDRNLWVRQVAIGP